jgi:hypothetical protein
MNKEDKASGVVRKMDSVHPSELGDQPSKPGTVQRLRQDEPLLQAKQGFKDYVSWMPNELSLHGKLVSNKPKSPGLCQEEAPNSSTRSSREIGNYRKELREGGGAPAALKNLP